MQQPIIYLDNPQPRHPDFRFVTPPQWSIYPHQHWAVIGANGAGKTRLVDVMLGQYALREGRIVLGSEGRISEVVKRIAFTDIHSLADTRNGYYQQRFHATENDEIPTVRELLAKEAPLDTMFQTIEELQLAPLLDSRINYLSSGELRKFLIARALLSKPRILVLDNPFIGLDAPSRGVLTQLFDRLTQQSDVQLVLLLSSLKDIPACITHLQPLHEMHCLPTLTRAEFEQDEVLQQQLFTPLEKSDIALPPATRTPSTHTTTVHLEHIMAGYGSRKVLDGVDWQVINGEKWALLGENGSGKSTLLSLVNADHPQSYANRFYLFDRKRGSGESIWDIKERIGYVSPEMHLYFTENAPAIKIVASGFFDSIGMFRRCSEQQLATALQWMAAFDIAHLESRPLLSLSSGEQRLVLLARAFVKDPDLLILDEPLHGLDQAHKERVSQLIEQFCARPAKTLIYVTHYIEEIPKCVNKRFTLQRNIK